MHLRRHARAVAVPVQQVEREGVVAEQVVVDHERPDQVVGAQHVEGGRHLAAFEEAALVHLVLEHPQLLLVDEHVQLTRFAEIHQGDEERRGLDAVVVVRRHP